MAPLSATFRAILVAGPFLLAGLLPGAALAADPPAEGGAVTPVASVDLQRYAGLWYEIAKIPNRFQDRCVSGTTARYTLREDGRIDVLNRCVEEGGGLGEAEGVAKVTDASGAKLKVSFVSFLGWRPFWGDYWVIGLDEEEYGWAVIGTPDRKYGWVLARTPSLPSAVLERIFTLLERNGYRRDSFEMSPQG